VGMAIQIYRRVTFLNEEKSVSDYSEFSSEFVPCLAQIPGAGNPSCNFVTFLAQD